ncbi:uncharacterized protein LOC117058256 isoform X3 [Lacerta agilis]|uniref:uncharacterized protein LOC117058256 isoform X3 n=1 Tax=Lacerta agilis TaxID=80427 RepID=UPI00141A5681|nr:uncharacterized protein LOC117058256 isoform X3 [Lacerta agilis]
MEKPRLEVVVRPTEEDLCQKRPAPASEEEQPVYKRLRMDSPIYPVESEASLPPERTCPTAPPPACSTALPLSTHQCKKPSRRPAYHPFDFTSDELDPAYEWPRESSSARKSGADVIPLLRSTLGQFPLGLRLDKLEALVWKEHKVKLWKLCLDRGYSDSLKFLEVVPGIRLKPSGKGTFRCLVQLDPGYKIQALKGLVCL